MYTRKENPPKLRPARRPRADAPGQKEEQAYIRLATEYLSRPGRLDERIRSLLDYQQALQRRVSQGASSPSDSYEARLLALRLRDVTKQADHCIDHLADLEREILLYLSRLDNQAEFRMLVDRFLDHRSVSDAAGHIQYEMRYAKKLQKRALVKVGRMLREDPPMRGYVSVSPPVPPAS